MKKITILTSQSTLQITEFSQFQDRTKCLGLKFDCKTECRLFGNVHGIPVSPSSRAHEITLTEFFTSPELHFSIVKYVQKM
jgi:hypothetical protein